MQIPPAACQEGTLVKTVIQPADKTATVGDTIIYEVVLTANPGCVLYGPSIVDTISPAGMTITSVTPTPGGVCALHIHMLAAANPYRMLQLAISALTI